MSFKDGDVLLVVNAEVCRHNGASALKDNMLLIKAGLYNNQEGMHTWVVYQADSSFCRYGTKHRIHDFIQSKQPIYPEMIGPDSILQPLIDRSAIWIINNLNDCTIKTEEPKNNDGRSDCYWCGEATKSIEFPLHWAQICPKCKK
jgi:hypothetical protein